AVLVHHRYRGEPDGEVGLVDAPGDPPQGDAVRTDAVADRGRGEPDDPVLRDLGQRGRDVRGRGGGGGAAVGGPGAAFVRGDTGDAQLERSALAGGAAGGELLAAGGQAGAGAGGPDGSGDGQAEGAAAQPADHEVQRGASERPGPLPAEPGAGGSGRRAADD